MSADGAFVACRFLFDIAALYLWGSCIFLWLQVPRALSCTIWRRIISLRLAAVLLIVTATVVSLPIRSAILTGDWSGALEPRMVADVLTTTSIGTAWIVQAGATLFLIAATFAPTRHKLWATAIASWLLLSSLVMIGHSAGMNSGWLRVVHRVNDMVHVLAGGYWFGALLPVLFIVQSLSTRAMRNDAVHALIAFSTVGHAAVSIVVLTGIANSWLILGGLPFTWSQPYQWLLTVKIALVVTMITLAVFNRYCLVPRLQQSAAALFWLRIWIETELALGAAVIALVSWFGMLEPTGG